MKKLTALLCYGFLINFLYFTVSFNLVFHLQEHYLRRAGVLYFLVVALSLVLTPRFSLMLAAREGIFFARSWRRDTFAALSVVFAILAMFLCFSVELALNLDTMW